MSRFVPTAGVSGNLIRVLDQRRSARAQLRSALWSSRWYVTAVAVQVAVSTILCHAARRAPFAGPIDAATTVLGAAGVFGAIEFLWNMFRRRESVSSEVKPLEAYRRAWRSLRSDRLTAEYLAGVAITLAGAVVALSAFSAAKQAIPAIRPFTWDSRLSALGSLLWRGHHLWELLQPALGKPEITIGLDWFYHRAWTAVLLGSFVCAAIMKPSAHRDRYLVAVVLVFVLVGNVAALAFASAGPAYFANVVASSPDPYAPLLQYLRSVDAGSPLISVRGEGALWYTYAHGGGGFGFGVSAMPSVHVAAATTTALFGYSISRPLGVALSLVAVGTLAGSVMLAWHYSLDGCVAALLAMAIWWLAGWLTSDLGLTSDRRRPK